MIMGKCCLFTFYLLPLLFVMVSLSNSANENYWIETVIFADYSVRERFDSLNEAQQYVSTIMKLTDQLFQHSTLGTNLSIVIQDIVWVSKSDSERILRGKSLNRSLHKFCSWVLRKYYLQYNYDHAIFLSRDIDLAAGISPLNQMCVVRYSCTLAEDSGFFSAYPIAHEMMHSLGIEHDGDGNHCDESGRTGNIMAPLVQSTKFNYHWSECTRDVLRDVIKSERFSCIRDFPVIRKDFSLWGQPGWYWSANKQCQILLGKGKSQICSPASHYRISTANMNLRSELTTGQEACHQLWCTDTNSPFTCTQMINNILLEGTVCGYNMDCQNGRCLPRNTLHKDSSGWGMFSPWSSCSRTCGSGTSFRVRKCHKRAVNGQSLCTGQDTEYQTCNSQECPYAMDYREEQCLRFEEFKYRGVFHTWLPHIVPDNECRLSCYSMETGDIHNAWESVRDGTLCNYQSEDHKCIQGKCVKFDCKGNVNGTAYRDRCGVCEGNGSTCFIIEHEVFRTVRGNGFDMIYIVPKFARKLEVVKVSPNHVIGIVDMDRRKFILEGSSTLRNSTRIHHGTKFTFKIDSTNHVETVTAKGPILGAILIQTRRINFSVMNRVKIKIKYLMNIINW